MIFGVIILTLIAFLACLPWPETGVVTAGTIGSILVYGLLTGQLGGFLG